VVLGDAGKGRKEGGDVHKGIRVGGGTRGLMEVHKKKVQKVPIGKKVEWKGKGK